MTAPVNTVVPALTGTIELGETLTASTGSWDNTPTAYAYAWLRDGVAIEGATSATYTIVRADVLAQLAARVTATNVDGSAAAISASTSAVPGTLIVEDGTGFSDADSYLSVEDADLYHATRGNADWAELSGADKEAALRRATDYLDGYYGMRWAGEEYAVGQALDWPRSYVPLQPVRQSWLQGWVSAYYLDVAPLPAVLLRATAELALKSATGTTLEPDLSPAVKQETVGPITTIYQDSARSNEVVFPQIDSYLSTLLASTGSIRLMRG